MKREDLVSNLGRLGYTLLRPETSKVKEHEVLDLLDELAGSEDSRLVEGFPVVLANCAQRDLILDFRSLLSRNQSDSRKQQALEKLLLLSSDLLAQQGLDKPKNLESLSNSLQAKYGDLLADDVVDLGNNVSLSTERLRRTLNRYTANLSTSKSTRDRAKNRQRRSFQLNYYLSTLFAPRQKELMTNKEVRKIATVVLTRK